MAGLTKDDSNVLFLIPWEAVSGERAAYFEQELARDLGPQHPLFGQPLEAIALTCERDDVLFRSEEGTVAQVHLTYTQNPPELFQGCPGCRIYPSLGDWMIDVMVSDHVDHFGLWDDNEEHKER